MFNTTQTNLAAEVAELRQLVKALTATVTELVKAFDDADFDLHNLKNDVVVLMQEREGVCHD